MTMGWHTCICASQLTSIPKVGRKQNIFVTKYRQKGKNFDTFVSNIGFKEKDAYILRVVPSLRSTTTIYDKALLVMELDCDLTSECTHTFMSVRYCWHLCSVVQTVDRRG